MASAMYDKGREAFGNGGVSWASDVIAAVLVQTGIGHYQVNLATDQFLSSIASGDRVATFSGLAGKTNVAGLFGCSDIVFSLVSGAVCGALVIYKDTGNPATSTLLYYTDGTMSFEVAVDASTSATSVVCEDLPCAFPIGATLTKISGTGPSTIVLSGAASLGARALSVVALASNIVAGAVYSGTWTGAGLQVTPNGANITYTVDPTNKLFKL